MSPIEIAIIGAGPAGLTLARLLQEASIGCTVFESDRDRHAANRGGSLDLHPDSGQRALKEAGLFDAFVKLSRPEGETLRIFSDNGTILMDESRGEEGRPETFANRPEIDRRELRNLLLDSLKPETVQWGCKLVEVVDPGRAGPLDLVFDNSRVEKTFGLIVGADGAWSKVRPALTSTKPFYSGVGGLDCRLTDVDSQHADLASHVGQGMCLNLGKDKGLMCQRNGDSSVQLYAFARLQQRWFAECGINFAHPSARRAVVDALYPEYSPLQKRLVLDSDEDTVSRQLYMLPIDFTWTHNARITLIGDAAHLMTPFAGVGVNLAMADSMDLARAIVGAEDDLSKRIQRFEGAMWQRAKSNAEATMMYLNLFFHESGGVAMVDHFKKQRAAESCAGIAKPVEEDG